MKVWFWYDRQKELGPRFGCLRGVTERGHFWLWVWRVNCGIILWNNRPTRDTPTHTTPNGGHDLDREAKSGNANFPA